MQNELFVYYCRRTKELESATRWLQAWVKLQLRVDSEGRTSYLRIEKVRKKGLLAANRLFDLL